MENEPTARIWGETCMGDLPTLKDTLPIESKPIQFFQVVNPGQPNQRSVLIEYDPQTGHEERIKPFKSGSIDFTPKQPTKFTTSTEPFYSQ